jgi:hypothetical protein
MINTALYNHHKAAMEVAAREYYTTGSVSPEKTIPFEELWSNKQQHPLYVIAGNHTRVALGELQDQFKNTTLFHLNNATVFLCKETPEIQYVQHAHTRTHTRHQPSRPNTININCNLSFSCLALFFVAAQLEHD